MTLCSRDIEKFPFAEKESLQSAVVEIEEVSCDVNADFAGITPLARQSNGDGRPRSSNVAVMAQKPI